MSNTFSPECYKLLKRFGYHYELVERFVQARGNQFRQDFMGFGDILAIRYLTTDDAEAILTPTEFKFTGCLCIQACSESTIQEHLRKVTLGTPSEKLKAWLLSDNRFELWGFPRRDRKTRKRAINGSSQLNVRFMRVTYEDYRGYPQFLTDETTELTAFGYKTREAAKQ
jgi:hypothetical protein